jgi:hypothetical protein
MSGFSKRIISKQCGADDLRLHEHGSDMVVKSQEEWRDCKSKENDDWRKNEAQLYSWLVQTSFFAPKMDDDPI